MEDKTKRFHFSTLLAVVAVLVAFAIAASSYSSFYTTVRDAIRDYGVYSRTKLNPKEEPFLVCLSAGFGYLVRLDFDERSTNHTEKSHASKYEIWTVLPGESADDKVGAYVRVTKNDAKMFFTWRETFTRKNGETRQVKYGFMYSLDTNTLYCQGSTTPGESDWLKGMGVTEEEARKYGLTQDVMRERGTSRLRAALKVCAGALDRGEGVTWFENADYFGGVAIEDYTGLGYTFE